MQGETVSVIYNEGVKISNIIISVLRIDFSPRCFSHLFIPQTSVSHKRSKACTLRRKCLSMPSAYICLPTQIEMTQQGSSWPHGSVQCLNMSNHSLPSTFLPGRNLKRVPRCRQKKNSFSQLKRESVRICSCPNRKQLPKASGLQRNFNVKSTVDIWVAVQFAGVSTSPLKGCGSIKIKHFT